MRKPSTLRKGTAGLLLVVFFMSFLTDGLAFKAIQFLSDHDHEFQTVPGAHGIHMKMVHEDHHVDSKVGLFEDQGNSRHFNPEQALGFHEDVEGHTDHVLSLMNLDDSIPSKANSSSTALQTTIALSPVSHLLSPSAQLRVISTCSGREPSTLVQVRSIVLRV